jgi:iron complex transport system substrate-binding protein
MTRRPARATRAALLASTAAALVLLAGCATPTTAVPSSPATTSAGPVSFRNCDTDVTFAKAPQRVVTIKSTSTEMMLALGVGDRIVGTAFQDGPVPDEWAADAKGLTSISDFMPSEEAVLDLEPDLVYAGWESAFSADASGTRSELLGLGVGSYVQPAACRSEGAPAKLTFGDVFDEIDQAAAIFQVSPTKLVSSQKAELAKITPDDRGLTALWYSSGDDTPYVGAGTGAPELVLETVGLKNIAADVAQTWTSLGWEAIVADNPDVIVLIDATWNTAQSKIDTLRANPATAELDAVKNDRYLILPFASSEAGVRTVSAVTSLAEQLKALDLP